MFTYTMEGTTLLFFKTPKQPYRLLTVYLYNPGRSLINWKFSFPGHRPWNIDQIRMGNSTAGEKQNI